MKKLEIHSAALPFAWWQQYRVQSLLGESDTDELRLEITADPVGLVQRCI